LTWSVKADRFRWRAADPREGNRARIEVFDKLHPFLLIEKFFRGLAQ